MIQEVLRSTEQVFSLRASAQSTCLHEFKKGGHYAGRLGGQPLHCPLRNTAQAWPPILFSPSLERPDIDSNRASHGRSDTVE